MGTCLWDLLPAELQTHVRTWARVLVFRDRIEAFEQKLRFPRELQTFTFSGYSSFSNALYTPIGTLHWRVSYVDGLLNAYHVSLDKGADIVHSWWEDYGGVIVLGEEPAVSNPFSAI